MYSYHGRASTETLPHDDQLGSEPHSAWQSAPPPWGGEWRDFFNLFSLAAKLQQPGVATTDLFQRTVGDRHATMPELRKVLEDARRDGIVVLLTDETARGTFEYYLLNPESRLLAELQESCEPVVLPKANEEGRQAVESFSKVSFLKIAQECGFLDGVDLSAQKLIDFFSTNSFTKTDIYNAREFYPVGIRSFVWNLRPFMDAVISHAVACNVVEEFKNDEGREMYRLAPAVAALASLV